MGTNAPHRTLIKLMLAIGRTWALVRLHAVFGGFPLLRTTQAHNAIKPSMLYICKRFLATTTRANESIPFANRFFYAFGDDFNMLSFAMFSRKHFSPFEPPNGLR